MVHLHSHRGAERAGGCVRAQAIQIGICMNRLQDFVSVYVLCPCAWQNQSLTARVVCCLIPVSWQHAAAHINSIALSFSSHPVPSLTRAQADMTDEERREEKLKTFTERQQTRQAEIGKRRAERLDGADPSEDAQVFFDAFKSRRAEIEVMAMPLSPPCHASCATSQLRTAVQSSTLLSFVHSCRIHNPNPPTHPTNPTQPHSHTHHPSRSPPVCRGSSARNRRPTSVDCRV
jgi:hypothetical protein